MYLGVDIGGTKTFVASIDDDGVIVEQQRFLTPTDYNTFLEELEKNLSELKNKAFEAATVAVPAGKIDRLKETAAHFGNLPWEEASIGKDISRFVDCPVYIENDAKLAALSEYMLLKDRFSKVLYVTISTGIGYGFIDNGQIDKSAGDGGGRSLVLERFGKHVPWETIASGHAIVERYGKMAKDIDDQETWQKIVKDLADGLILLIGVFQPEVIAFGGSVGNYFDKYGEMLKHKLASYDVKKLDLPKLIEAGRPEEAVVYGCYDHARIELGNA
jgi:predicted NBD/HSP70 family sugar kinase